MKDAEPRPLGGDDDVAVAIVVARTNEDVARRLLRGALEVLTQRGIGEPELYWVPAALDLPVIALSLAEKGGPDAIVALASVVADDLTAMQTMQGLMQAQLDTGVPIAFGVLVTDDKEQALAQSGPKKNKGAEAAEGAVEMANLLRTIQG